MDATGQIVIEMDEKIQQLKAKAETVSIRGNRDYNPGWHTALDLQNLLTVAEAVAISAVNRKESRGGHYRSDFPSRDDARWQRHVADVTHVSG